MLQVAIAARRCLAITAFSLRTGVPHQVYTDEQTDPASQCQMPIDWSAACTALMEENERLRRERDKLWEEVQSFAGQVRVLLHPWTSCQCMSTVSGSQQGIGKHWNDD